MHTQSKKGFTLIELLVVIAIIGILSSVVIVSLNTARAKARDSSRTSNVQAIGTAIAVYAGDHNPEAAPAAVATLNGTALPTGGWVTGAPDMTGGTAPAFNTYMKSLPTDGTAGTYAFYNAGADATYCLGTHLEQSSGGAAFLCTSAGCASSSTVTSAYSGGAWATAWGTAPSVCSEF